jgi:tetratricopeptide (TPR) repeat protein
MNVPSLYAIIMMNPKAILIAFIAILMAVSPVIAAEEINQTDNAWYWYNNAVDLANAGKFPDALQANEKALAINQNFPLAWANEAGILVQVGRYDEAIKAADTVLQANVSGFPMKNTFAAAYYSKGDAQTALGNVTGAQDSYRKAHELDPTLPIPEMISGTVIAAQPSVSATAPGVTAPVQATPSAPAARTPLSAVPVIGGVLIALFFCSSLRTDKK